MRLHCRLRAAPKTVTGVVRVVLEAGGVAAKLWVFNADYATLGLREQGDDVSRRVCIAGCAPTSQQVRLRQGLWGCAHWWSRVKDNAIIS